MVSARERPQYCCAWGHLAVASAAESPAQAPQASESGNETSRARLHVWCGVYASPPGPSVRVREVIWREPHVTKMKEKTKKTSRARAWKDILTWAVRRAFFQQGMRVLLHPPTSGGRVPAITARVAGYVRALRRMPIVRGVPHAQMTAAQVRLEGLVGNPSVAKTHQWLTPMAGSTPLTARCLQPCAPGGAWGRCHSQTCSCSNCQQHGQPPWVLSRCLSGR
jgi:hypothetical protein